MRTNEFLHAPLSKQILRTALQVFVLVNLALLLYYVLVDYQFMLNSDAAVKNLLAQEIAETGAYFPPDWRYVNGDLWVLYSHTFVLPLLGMHANSFALHALSGLVSTALILTGTWLVTGIAGQSRNTRLCSLLVIMGGFSPFMAENVFGQVAYGAMYYMACFLFYFAWRFLQSAGRARWTWGTALLLTAVLAFWANPQRAVLYYALPLACATALQLWQDYLAARANRQLISPPPQARRQTIVLGLLALGAVGGTLLHLQVMATAHNIVGAGAPVWLSFDQMVGNLEDCMQGLVSVLGGQPIAGQKVASLSGAYQAARLLFTLLFLGLLPWAFLRGMRSAERGRVFFTSFALIAASLTLFVQATTSVADMTVPETVVRYMIPGLLLSVVVFISAICTGQMSWLTRTIGVAVILIFATSGLQAYEVPYSLGRFTHAGLAQENPRVRVYRYLEREGLHYGYASYWNAGALTVISGGHVKVRQILLNDGFPQPMRHLGSDRWYEPAAWQGPSFVLLSDAEFKEINWPLVESFTGKPQRSLNFEDWHIVVFDKNIATVLPLWSRAPAQPLRWPMLPHAQHQIGQYRDGALESAIGENGMLHFGPYFSLAAGSYVADFEIEVNSPADQENMGVLDVASAGGTIKYGELKIAHSGAQHLRLPFTLAQPSDSVEMRAYTNGVAAIRLRSIAVSLAPAH